MVGHVRVRLSFVRRGCACVVNRVVLMRGLLGPVCLHWVVACLCSYCGCTRSSDTAYAECMFALISFCDLVWLEAMIVFILISGELRSLCRGYQLYQARPLILYVLGAAAFVVGRGCGHGHTR